MKVFIAGATGAIGHPLISRLVAAGHDVVGMTSSERGLQTLRGAGAEGVVANALDAQAVQVAMNKARPDAVIEELTSLPKHYTPEEMRAAADRDRTVRLDGGRNLQNAARAAGARRYIVQSTGFFYAPDVVYSRWRRCQPSARSEIGNPRFRAGGLVMGARRGCCSSDHSSTRMYSRCLQHRR